MGTPPIHHPPVPKGATKRELQTIAALHREATTTDDQLAGSTMLDGVGLIVELIQDRGRKVGPVHDRDLDQGEAPEGLGGLSTSRTCSGRRGHGATSPLRPQNTYYRFATHSGSRGARTSGWAGASCDQGGLRHPFHVGVQVRARQTAESGWRG